MILLFIQKTFEEYVVYTHSRFSRLRKVADDRSIAEVRARGGGEIDFLGFREVERRSNKTELTERILKFPQPTDAGVRRFTQMAGFIVNSYRVSSLASPLTDLYFARMLHSNGIRRKTTRSLH
jgi:hypothetical protein